MEARAIARYMRISPRKTRQVIDLIRGKSVLEAENILKLTPKKGARIIQKVLKSAKANVTQIEPNVREEKLYVKKAYVDEGPVFKRIRPRSRGRASWIRKKTSHIAVVVGTTDVWFFNNYLT
ncbi:MAG: 50S ribosomal protein L22 [bacterium]|nr:50S ribosomal protein L22 [bacterium]